MLTGDLKQMDARWVRGASLVGYGTSLMIGVGIPIPVLDEEVAWHTSVSNRDIVCPVVDYGSDYPKIEGQPIGQVSYADLFSGKITVRGKEIPATPLSSLPRAREIADILKGWIGSGAFTLGASQMPLPAPAERVPLPE